MFFKAFVNFAVSHGMYFGQKKKSKKNGKNCYLSQCLAARTEKTAASGALQPVFAALIDPLLPPLLCVFPSPLQPFFPSISFLIQLHEGDVSSFFFTDL